jgi:site-specific recombinase XerD
VANIVDSTQNDDFAEYKRQYEFHADAWLVARALGEQGLSRRSAQQMLRALRGMYRFLQIHKR